jgi:hypothetical protein
VAIIFPRLAGELSVIVFVAHGEITRNTHLVQHTESQPELPLKEKANPWGLGLSLAFVTALALCAAFMAVDMRKTRNGQLEQFSESTGAGDLKFVPLESFVASDGPPKISVNGVSVQIMPAPKIGVRDSRMLRVEKDAATGVSIYRTEQANLKGQRLKGAGDNSPIYFVKVGVNEYVQARYAK